MLRRYASLKPSRGTVIPLALRREVLIADGFRCVPHEVLGMNGDCLKRVTGLELDHVRASGGLSLKSATVKGNLASMCAGAHRERTLNGREWRPILLQYIAERDGLEEAP